MKLRKPHKLKKPLLLYLYRWVDPTMASMWWEAADIEAQLTDYEAIVSVGFLIRKPSKDHPFWVFAADLDPGCMNWNRVALIPKQFLVGMTLLNTIRQV